MAKLISKTYGDALFELAVEEDKIDVLLEEIEQLQNILEQNEDFGKLMNHPKIIKEEKIQVAENVFKGRISKELLGFLTIIISKDRYKELDEILAYYKLADVFVCLSEHEGFCVPLVEAMFFDVPVIAYDSCAVGETLGGSGLLLQDKTPAVVGEAIHRVVSDEKLKQQIIANQRIRLKDFEHDRIKEKFLKTLESWI